MPRICDELIATVVCREWYILWHLVIVMVALFAHPMLFRIHGELKGVLIDELFVYFSIQTLRR